jgi:hypothetical protein
MTLSALGIFSAAGAGGGVSLSDYELISTSLITTNTSSVTFSSLGDYSSTYKHLQLRITGRVADNYGNDGDAIRIRFNADGGNNYSYHALYGVNGGVNSNASTSTTAIFVNRLTDAGTTANAFGAIVSDILDAFSSTKNKTVRTLGSDVRYLFFNSGAWLSTSSITSIQLSPNTSSNFAAGSRISLYGLKG